MKPSDIKSHSIIVFRPEKTNVFDVPRGYHVVVTTDNQLEVFESGLSGSPPVYSCQVNPQDPNTYPIIMLDMAKRKAGSVELVDTLNMQQWKLDEKQCTYANGDGRECMLSFVTQGDRIAPILVPGPKAHRVRELDAVKAGAVVLRDSRDPTHHASPMFADSVDGQAVRMLSQLRLPKPCTAALVHQAVADVLLACSNAQRLILQGPDADSLRGFVLQHMPADVEVANRPLPEAGDEWVTHNVLGRR